MADIDPFAATGAMLTAFATGATIFYMLGRDGGPKKFEAEISRLKDRIEDLLRDIHSHVKRITSQEATIRSLSEAVDKSKEKIGELEANRTPPPPMEQANRLVQTLLTDEADAWLSSTPIKPSGHDTLVASMTTKIICVANLKGGVGKTTTTANLAAYFDRELNKRVLVIDADYQGSLSAIFKTMARNQDITSTTAEWLEGVEDVERAAASTNRINDDMRRTKFVAAFYPLSHVEIRLMIQWLLANMLHEPRPVDLRYALSRILHSNAITSRFDVVLIDCPPRLSTATINALAASTHLLVPSVPDNSSLEAAANFLQMVRTVTAQLNPNIQVLGIAPMLTLGSALHINEKRALEDTKTFVSRFAPEPYIFERNIPRNTSIASLAGTAIALIRGDANTKRMLKAFGAEVAERLWNSASANQSRPPEAIAAE